MWVCKYRINVVYTEQLTKIRKEKKQGVVEVNTSKISFTRMEILKTRHSTNQDEVEARTTADATAAAIHLEPLLLGLPGAPGRCILLLLLLLLRQLLVVELGIRIEVGPWGGSSRRLGRRRA